MIAIGIDDNVRALGNGVVDACLEGAGKALVAPVTDDVVDTVGKRHFDGAVTRSVVDNLEFNGFDAIDFARQIVENARERGFLVLARYLDHELETCRAQVRAVGNKPLGLDRPVNETHRQVPLRARPASREMSATMLSPADCLKISADRG